MNQSAGPNREGGGLQINVSSTALMSVGGPEVIPTEFIAAPRMELTAFTVQDLAQLLASSSEDNLPARKLVQYNADPLQGHGWFGLFESAIDSAPLTDDVKLTFLKALVEVGPKRRLQSLLTTKPCTKML